MAVIREYGSKRHLQHYLEGAHDRLDDKIARATGSNDRIRWLHAMRADDGQEREYRGLGFLPGEEYEAVHRDWRAFWPRRGNQQNWDAVGHAGERWLLVEAKANWPEFCSPPTTAAGDGRKTIEHALNEVKEALGVHRYFSWTGTYYQYGNRLAALWFLRRHGVDAHLVFVYFIGDRFPDGTPCPGSESDWWKLIEARRLTLGLAEEHALSRFEHDVVLPVLD